MDDPLEPIGIYGALKLAGEKLVIAYNQVFGVPYTILRLSALYGPRCEPPRRPGVHRIGARRLEPARRRRRRREARLHYDDVVNGVIAGITHEGGRNEIFNMTAGKGCSLRDLVTLVQEHFPEIDVEYVERDALRPYRGTLSMDKARDLIEHVLRVELEEGLAKYVDNWQHRHRRRRRHDGALRDAAGGPARTDGSRSGSAAPRCGGTTATTPGGGGSRRARATRT